MSGPSVREASQLAGTSSLLPWNTNEVVSVESDTQQHQEIIRTRARGTINTLNSNTTNITIAGNGSSMSSGTSAISANQGNQFEITSIGIGLGPTGMLGFLGGGFGIGRPVLGSICGNTNTKRHYIDDVPDEIKCPICFDGAITCSTHCKHSFCLYCIHSHMQSRIRQSQQVNCPMCRAPIHFYQLLPLQGEVYNKVRTLRIACVGMQNGCLETGSSNEVEIHEMSCEYILVMCRFKERGCSAQIMRKEVKLHECRCRYNPDVDPCKYQSSGCKVRGTSHLLELHEKKCRYRNMEKFVPCPHRDLGCGLLVKKRIKAEHAECCAFKVLADAKDKDVTACGFRISMSWSNKCKTLPLEEVECLVSKIFPNVITVHGGKHQGEVHVVIQRAPVTAYKGLVMATNQNASSSLKDMGLRVNGITTFQV